MENIEPAWLIGQTGVVIVAVSLLWWRMATAEKAVKELWDHYDKVKEKLERLNGPRLDNMEAEMLRTRDRLHKAEGKIVLAEHLVEIIERKQR